jgi:hypothetical protein
VRLPEVIAAKVRDLPEDSMGAHRVALVLDDGTIIDDVVVAWSREVIRVGGSDEFDVPLDRVVDVLERP